MDVSQNASVCRLQIVKEKLVCYGTVRAQEGRNLVMTVNIICEFIAPLIQLSTKQLIYRLEKVSGAVLAGEWGLGGGGGRLCIIMFTFSFEELN